MIWLWLFPATPPLSLHTRRTWNLEGPKEAVYVRPCLCTWMHASQTAGKTF